MNTDERNLFQKENFNKVKKILLENGIKILHSSEANSGSIEQKNGLDNNTHIRPGIMMYGPSSLNSDVKNIGGFSGKTVSTLETHILKVFEVKKGIPVGYNSTLAPDDGIVAILAIGYGDGFFNRYSGAHLMHNGHVGKIIGRVSMDMTHVFFSSSAKNDITSLDKFVIWGQENGDLVRFKNEVNIIPYELFCALLPRIPRIYKLN
jgi:alanine racemase